MCLLLVRLGRKDEVARNDREFIEYEEVRWRCGWDVDDVEVWRRVGEGVEVFFSCWRRGFEFGERFLCERGAVAELELRRLLVVQVELPVAWYRYLLECRSKCE